MTDFDLNCDDLPGRLRDICRGFDKDGKPVLTRAKRDRYRELFATGELTPRLSLSERRELQLTKSREAWRQLHQYALDHWDSWDDAAAREWFTGWEKLIPGFGCDCRLHWRKMVRSMPPDFSSANNFFIWGVAVHNNVNERLGKPLVAVDEARAAASRKIPLWVRALRWLRTQDDRGAGDTAQRIAAKFGGERFKRFSKKVGLPCACANRQDKWNARWPYQD